jgi:hypothetical protein
LAGGFALSSRRAEIARDERTPHPPPR